MSIDRRDAIKKLAVGGVTVATASAVISSPAFAYDLPTPPPEPVVVAIIDPNDANTLIVTLSPGVATCNASATGGASVAGSAHTAAGVPVPSTVVVSPVTETVNGPGPLQSVRFTRTDADPAGAQLNYFVVYRCIYGGGTGDLCAFRTISFETVGAAWSTTPSIIAQPSC